MKTDREAATGGVVHAINVEDNRETATEKHVLRTIYFRLTGMQPPKETSKRREEVAWPKL
jgi:hypothetical protein